MNDSFKPVCTQNFSYKVDVEEGKNYMWCACGLSKAQPFCDGSHKGTGVVPVAYKADVDKKVGFCGCRKTASAPLCDGMANAFGFSRS